MSDGIEEIKRRSGQWCAAYLEAEAERQRLQAENEQLRVQLAGCGVVALGLASGVAKPGDYGWSDSYQRVVELRTKFNALIRAADEMAEVGRNLPATYDPWGTYREFMEAYNNYRKLREGGGA